MSVKEKGGSELRDVWPDQQTWVQVSVGNRGCALGRGSSHFPTSREHAVGCGRVALWEKVDAEMV